MKVKQTPVVIETMEQSSKPRRNTGGSGLVWFDCLMKYLPS